MHNVAACFSGLCPEKLDLSNTWTSRKTLSFPKPPHTESSFAAFQTVLDEIAFPGKGKGGTLQGSVRNPFREVPSVPSEEALSWP